MQQMQQKKFRAEIMQSIFALFLLYCLLSETIYIYFTIAITILVLRRHGGIEGWLKYHLLVLVKDACNKFVYCVGIFAWLGILTLGENTSCPVF